jgi:hypothetical protein
MSDINRLTCTVEDVYEVVETEYLKNVPVADK